MTRKEISEILANNGFTLHKIYGNNDTYINGEIEVFVADTITAFYVDKLQNSFFSTLKYHNDELCSIKITEHEDYENFKKLTIETKASENEIFFK